MGLILDTSVLVEAERKRLDVAGVLKHIQATVGEQDLALTTVTVVELEHGIWRARQADREEQRRRFLEALLEAVPAYPLTTEIARLAGKIDAQCRERGSPVSFQDLIIGVTALHFGYSVLTLNIRHFERIPDLEVTQF